jgi:hypothetical protein
MVPIGIVVAVVVFAVGFFGLYRPWNLKWGATPDDLARSMPGDEIVPHPIFNATRAVTIDATPQDIWPWIVQIGFNRAGWYSYDLFDNLGRHSSERIVPGLQHTDVGDLVPLGPGEGSGMFVKEFILNASMLWWTGKDGQTTWAWGLYPTLNGTTRLVTRVRVPFSWRQPVSGVWLLLDELADFPMMRKCLLGIKRRAEAQASNVCGRVLPPRVDQIAKVVGR